MKKCFLDSNLLVYLKGELTPSHGLATKKLEQLVSEGTTLFISPLILDEFIHSVEFKLKLVKAKNILTKVKETLDDILSIPNLIIINPPTDLESQRKIVIFMKDFGLHPRDAYHLLTMQANQIDSFATFDNDFSKVFEQKILFKV